MNLDEVIKEQKSICLTAENYGSEEVKKQVLNYLEKLEKTKENQSNNQKDKFYLVEIYHPNYSIDREYRKEKETALELFEEKIEELKNKYKVSNIEKQYIFKFEKEEKNEKPLKKLIFTVLEEMQYAYGEEREEHLHLDLKEIEVL
jgi:hypothetical protein